MKNYIYIDASEGFAHEVYERTENEEPDNSLEYMEAIEMTVCELACQYMTGQANCDEKSTKIYISESVQEFLEMAYEYFEEEGDLMFLSLEMSEMMEEFLYHFGKYLTEGNFSKPFDW